MLVFDQSIVPGIVGSIGLVLFYGYSFWRIFKANPRNKVIECGSITIMVFVVILALFKAKLAVWVLPYLGMLVFWLGLLTMFFLAQRGYRALRRRRAGRNQETDRT